MCKAILVDKRHQRDSNFGFAFDTERKVRHIFGVWFSTLTFQHQHNSKKLMQDFVYLKPFQAETQVQDLSSYLYIPFLKGGTNI